MNRFEKPTIKISMFSQVIGTSNDPIMVSGNVNVLGTSLFDEATQERIHKISYETLKFN